MTEYRKPAGESSMKADTSMSFETLTGESIQARLMQVDFRSEAASSACEITFEVSSESYEQIAQNEWFHLFRNMSGDAPAFEPDGAFEIRAALRSNLAALFALRGGDAEDVFHALLGRKPATAETAFVPLNRTECWIAMEVKQQVTLPGELQGAGTLKTGYRTNWSEPALEEEASSLQERIESFLQLKGLKYEHADEQIIRLRFSSRGGSWTGLIYLAESEGFCAIYSVMPDPIPEPSRQAVALALMNANYDLSGGNYEMDEEDGEVRFRTTVFLASTRDAGEFGAILAGHLEQVESDLPTIRQWTDD